MSKRSFLLSLTALLAQGLKVSKGRTFLQLNLYDRMPQKIQAAYFQALDRHYAPEMSKAPGLLLYQRFHHYDLPEKVSIEIWESEEAAKAWHDGERARRLWELVVKDLPPRGIGAEYRQAMHSMAHRHYTLEESFRAL